MFDINIKWEHLTDETKKNIIDEFIGNLCVEDLSTLLENIEYVEENAVLDSSYEEYEAYNVNEFSFKKSQMYLVIENFLARHFPFTLTI